MGELRKLKFGQTENNITPYTAGDNTVIIDGEAKTVRVNTDVIARKGEGGGGSTMEETTWAALKAKRDDGELTPGGQYRITDYVCTTTQEKTRAVSHPFDIIVVADSESTLNENARACHHSSGNVTAFDGSVVVGQAESGNTFIITPIEISIASPAPSKVEVTYDGTTYILPIDGEPSSPYGYGEPGSFENYPLYINLYDTSALITRSDSTGRHTLKVVYQPQYYNDIEAWELKYRIDNDAYNYPWVDATNGKGVIYWMKDNFNNECPYDFKQIQFARYKITACEAVPSLIGKYTALEHESVITAVDEENPVWCYTFSVEGQGDMLDATVTADNVVENKISAFSHDLSNKLNEIVFTMGNCSYNTFGNECQSNTFGNECRSNTFGNSCSFNTFGGGCDYNTFGNYCQSNTFGDSCNSNTFGDSCYSNTLGEGCQSNTFGGGCDSNTFGNYCRSNTFGDSCQSNTFGGGCDSNAFGDNCQYVDFAAGAHLVEVQYYHILDGVQGTSSSHVTIPATEGNNYETYIGKNSQGVLKTWVPADIAQ